MVNPISHWPQITFGTRFLIPLRGLSSFQGIGFHIPFWGLSSFRVILIFVVPEIIFINDCICILTGSLG